MKSTLDLAKVLRLPRNLHLTFRTCRACHAFQSLRKVDLAKVLRLPRNLHPTSPKCCACHAIQTLRNLCVAVPIVPAPSPLRDRSETAPSPLRPDAADRLAFASPETPIHAQRHAFCDFLISKNADSRTGPCFLRLSLPLPHAREFYRGLIPSLVICLRELAFN